MLRSNQTIPIRELWDGFNPNGVDRGIFVLFKGYIDESYDGQQKLFALSCLVSYGKQFSEMERMWKLHLAAKNRQLKKEGRPLISRYHATDCNARCGEFKGWDRPERDKFVLGLFGIFKRVKLHSVGIDVNLDDLCEVFPEFAHDRLEMAYRILLDFVMCTIAEDIHKTNPEHDNWRISLVHDRTANGKYDPALLRQFDTTKHSPDFEYGKFFTTIVSLASQDCLLLQPADLVAFEIFREAQQKNKGHESRKSFEALVNLESFGIHTRSFVGKEKMRELRRLGEKRMRIREGAC